MLLWVQGSICEREMKNNRSCSVNDKEIENKKEKKSLEPKEAGLRLNHDFPFITSEMYKRHFSVFLCIECTDVMSGHALINQDTCDDSMMILRLITLYIAEKHLLLRSLFDRLVWNIGHPQMHCSLPRSVHWLSGEQIPYHATYKVNLGGTFLRVWLAFH